MLSRWISILGILILTACVIFYSFPTIPRDLFHDEVEFSKLALSLQHVPYTPYSEMATGHSTLYFYVILLSFKLFGVNQFALRLPAAIFGLLSVPMFCAIITVIKQLKHKAENNFPNYLPFILGVVFLSSRWFFNFARYSFEATFLLFLELVSIYFFISAWRKPNLWRYIISAIFAGLAFHSYYPGRIFFLLPIIMMIIYKRNEIKKILVYLAVVIFIASPLILYNFRHPDKRFQYQFFLLYKNYTIEKKISFLGENITKTLLFTSFKGDMNGRHNYPGKPALNPILSILFFVGLLSSIRHLKDFPNSLFIGYLALSLLPSIFTSPYENPNMLRTYTAIPAIVYFMGNAIKYIYEKWKYKKTSLLIAFIFLLSISTAYELRTYFIFQSDVFNHDASRKANKLEDVLRWQGVKY